MNFQEKYCIKTQQQDETARLWQYIASRSFQALDLPMQLLRLNSLASHSELPRTAVTIGNFDGVHLGHQAMIRQLQQVAEAQGLKSVVMILVRSELYHSFYSKVSHHGVYLLSKPTVLLQKEI